MAIRQYISSIPTPQLTQTANADHFESMLGPKSVYPFPKYTKLQLLGLLRKYLGNQLLDTCPIHHLSVYSYMPTLLFDHYAIPFTDRRPIYFFSHWVKKQSLLTEPERVIPYYGCVGHWVAKARTEIKSQNVVVGYLQKSVLYCEGNSGKCFRTRYRMEEISLLDNDELDHQPGSNDTRCGNWKIIKLYMVRHKFALEHHFCGCFVI